MAEDAATIDLVRRDLPCIRCGYDLRHLPLVGRCPECGENVRASWPGRHLWVADYRWYRRLRLGAALYATCLLLMLILILAVILLGPHAFGGTPLPLYGTLIIGISVGTAGIWLTTTREPGGPYHDERPWLADITGAIAVLTWSGTAAYCLIQFISWLIGHSFLRMILWQQITGILSFGGGLLATALTTWHFAHLAKRLDSPRLVLFGRLSAFSTPILVAMLFALSLVSKHLHLPYIPAMIVNLTVYSLLLLWPAIYCLVWRYHTGKPRRPQ